MLQIGRGAEKPEYEFGSSQYASIYASATNKLFVHRYSPVAELCDMIDSVEKYHNKRPSALVMRPENIKRLMDLTRGGYAATVTTDLPFGKPVGKFDGIDVYVEMI